VTIKELLVWFGILYFLLLIVGAVVIQAIGLKSSSGVNVAALLAAVMINCSSYGKKNGFYLDKDEKTKVVLGMIAIDMLLQLVFTLLTLPGAGKPVSLAIILGVLAFVGALHGIAIYVFVGMVEKQLEKSGYK